MADAQEGLVEPKSFKIVYVPDEILTAMAKFLYCVLWLEIRILKSEVR
jgi:hypothetical protein